MENFADQCLDMAQSILGHNLESISEQGTLSPVIGEESRLDEPGHAALAIGEYYRVTNETTLGDYDLVDLAARSVTAQAFTEEDFENGLAYMALGLLSFGPAKDRNPVWERLLDPTREQLDKRLLERSDFENHYQSFNIAKAVTRYSLVFPRKTKPDAWSTVSWSASNRNRPAATLMMPAAELANWVAPSTSTG